MTEETEEFQPNEKLEESIQKKTSVAYKLAYKECNTKLPWGNGIREVVERELNKNLTQKEKQYKKNKEKDSIIKLNKTLLDFAKEDKKRTTAWMDDNWMKTLQSTLAYDHQRIQEQNEYRENIAKMAQSTAKIAENTTKKRKAVIMASVISLVMGLIIATISPLILPFIKYLWFLITT